MSLLQMNAAGAIMILAITVIRALALERLLTHFDGMLQYIINGILEDPREREDCLAEVRAKLWEHRSQYDPSRSSPATWLTALCRNAAYDRLRALDVNYHALAVIESADENGIVFREDEE